MYCDQELTRLELTLPVQYSYQRVQVIVKADCEPESQLEEVPAYSVTSRFASAS